VIEKKTFFGVVLPECSVFSSQNKTIHTKMAERASMTLWSKKGLIFGAALLAGTGCSLTSKALLDIHGEDEEGKDEALASPPVR
jgi:hypothetical protein